MPLLWTFIFAGFNEKILIITDLGVMTGCLLKWFERRSSIILLILINSAGWFIAQSLRDNSVKNITY